MMRQVHLVITSDMKPLPESIRQLKCINPEIKIYGMAIDGKPELMICGEHIMIEADSEDLKSWLSSLDGVWMGLGDPKLQNFEIVYQQ